MRKALMVILAMVGFSFAERVLVIDVDGMTCKVCPIAVKKAISKLKGVKWVKTSLNNRVAVVVTEDNVSKEDVLKAISGAGSYRGKLIGEAKF